MNADTLRRVSVATWSGSGKSDAGLLPTAAAPTSSHPWGTAEPRGIFTWDGGMTGPTGRNEIGIACESYHVFKIKSHFCNWRFNVYSRSLHYK